MKLKAGMWFRDDLGFECVLMSTKPDVDGDLFNLRLDSRSWSFNTPGRIAKFWTPMRREPWIPFETRTLKSTDRQIEHTFRAVYSPDGRKAMIMAGCKAWPSFAEARRHFRTRYRDFYTEKQNKTYNAAAMRYLDRLEEAMRARRAVKKLRTMVAQRRAA